MAFSVSDLFSASYASVRSAVAGMWSRFGRVADLTDRAAASRDGTGAHARRQAQFDYLESMLENRVYLCKRQGGYRESILEHLLGVTATDGVRISGHYTPVKSIVGAYQNVFRGTFGQGEFTIADEVNGKPVNALLLDKARSPLRQVWKDSRLDSNKQVLQRWAANLGTVGLRVVANPKTQRISIQFDHPARLYDWDEDDDGNVVAMELRYPSEGGGIGERRAVQVREVFTKERIYRELDGKADTDVANALGVCPYVVLRHEDSGEQFGLWAYVGSDVTIHEINWLITTQGESVRKHIFPKWFAAAGGNPPANFDVGAESVAYVKMDPDTPPPIFQPLVANLDQAGAREFWLAVRSGLLDAQPELVLASIEALSGQSGETLAKLLKPAEAKILQARTQYEHAMVRAMQIAASWGILYRKWDLGTGTGSADAADRAYKGGLEDFAFAERPALPPTSYDLAQQAAAEQAKANAEGAKQTAKFAGANAGKDLLDQQTRMEMAGMSPQQIQQVQQRRATQDSIPTENL